MKKEDGMIRAYCYRSGLIEFGARMPKGCLHLVMGDEKEVREVVSGNARRAYDNVTLLVPGIPEAQDDTAAVVALCVFQKRLAGLLEVHPVKKARR